MFLSLISGLGTLEGSRGAFILHLPKLSKPCRLTLSELKRMPNSVAVLLEKGTHKHMQKKKNTYLCS